MFADVFMTPAANNNLPLFSILGQPDKQVFFFCLYLNYIATSVRWLNLMVVLYFSLTQIHQMRLPTE